MTMIIMAIRTVATHCTQQHWVELSVIVCIYSMRIRCLRTDKRWDSIEMVCSTFSHFYQL